MNRQKSAKERESIPASLASDLRERVEEVDAEIVRLLAKRAELSRLIERAKTQAGEPILCPENEKRRFRKAAALARQLGLPRDYIGAVFYLLFAHSCRVQIAQREGKLRRTSK